MRDALNEITREQQAVQLKDKEALKLAEAANMAALARQDEAARGLARALVFAEQRETEVFAEQRETEAERKASEAAATMEASLVATAAREAEADQRVSVALAEAAERMSEAARIADEAVRTLAAAEAMMSEATRKEAEAAAMLCAVAEREVLASRRLSEARVATLEAERREICARQLQAALDLEVGAFERARSDEARREAQRHADLDPNLIFEAMWYGFKAGPLLVH